MSAILTAAEVRAMVERASAATGGEWTAGDWETDMHPDGVPIWTEGKWIRDSGGVQVFVGRAAIADRANDAAFIAASRSDLPALAASHEAMRVARHCGAGYNEAGERDPCREQAAGRELCDLCASRAAMERVEEERDRLAAAVARVEALAARWDRERTMLNLARNELRAALKGDAR